MRDDRYAVKDRVLTDAIKTALDLSYKIVVLKRIIIAMGITILLLIAGYFVR